MKLGLTIIVSPEPASLLTPPIRSRLLETDAFTSPVSFTLLTRATPFCCQMLDLRGFGGTEANAPGVLSAMK